MSSVHITPGCSVLVHMTYATDKLVTLQCDHSSLHLTKELQKCLITADVLKELEVDEINLSEDLINHR